MIHRDMLRSQWTRHPACGRPQKSNGLQGPVDRHLGRKKRRKRNPTGETLAMQVFTKDHKLTFSTLAGPVLAAGNKYPKMQALICNYHWSRSQKYTKTLQLHFRVLQACCEYVRPYVFYIARSLAIVGLALINRTGTGLGRLYITYHEGRKIWW
jgi:hypothetical protein